MILKPKGGEGYGRYRFGRITKKAEKVLSGFYCYEEKR